MTGTDPVLSCPSAQPDMAGAEVFGVVDVAEGAPRIAYLKANAVISPEVMASLGVVDPVRVFRFSGKCENGRCAQFDGGRCGLGARIAAQLPAVVDALPSCRIRASCRWFAEQGGDICLRCPQVVTLVPPEMTALRTAARGDAEPISPPPAQSPP